MESFYNEIKTKTLENAEKMKNEKKEKYDERMKRLEDSLKYLRNEILKDLEKKIDDASEKGYNYTIIYSYTKDEKINDAYYTNFLLRGPNENKGYGKGIDYFTNHGFKPILDEIGSCIIPFRLSLRYSRYSKLNTIAVHW